MSDFITKDSGKRQEFASGMVRDSAEKTLRPDLIPGEMLVRWAELMGRGALKYGERNWELANSEEELARMKASAFRHFLQWFYGLNTEEDHAAAVFFNISGAEYVKAKLEKVRHEKAAEPSIPAPPWEEKPARPVRRGDVLVHKHSNERYVYGAAPGPITNWTNCCGWRHEDGAEILVP